MMRRIAIFALATVVLGSGTGCSSNPLIGKWQNVEASPSCVQSRTFTSTQALEGDQVPSPGADVTYTVGDKVVYVSGTAGQMGNPPTPYNIVDNDHIALVFGPGAQCTYARVK